MSPNSRNSFFAKNNKTIQECILLPTQKPPRGGQGLAQSFRKSKTHPAELIRDPQSAGLVHIPINFKKSAIRKAAPNN